MQVLSGQHCCIIEQQFVPQHVVPMVQQVLLSLQQVEPTEQQLVPQQVDPIEQHLLPQQTPVQQVVSLQHFCVE